MFIATKVCLSRQKKKKKARFCRDKTWANVCRDKSSIIFDVTKTTFNFCDDLLVKGRSYMHQPKSVQLGLWS